MLPTPLKVKTVSTRTNLETLRAEDMIGLSNAVALREGFLTANHVIVRAGWKLQAVFVEGVEVVPIASNGELVVLFPKGVRRGTPKLKYGFLRPSGEEIAEGQKLWHIYYDHVNRRLDQRQVTWSSPGYIKEECPQGMFGSGIYDARDRLAALVKWSDGMVLGPLDLNAFFESEGVELYER